MSPTQPEANNLLLSRIGWDGRLKNHIIETVTLKHFKRFSSTTFNITPSGLTFLAGANNSGKSSFLQALAVWEFARTVLEMERGKASLLKGYNGQGLGVADDEFSPVALASLKHLWTNLKTQNPGAQNGYSLSITCRWKDTNDIEKCLGISLALANDRLFIKASDSSLLNDDKIPRIAYLPSFAGITSKEQFMSPADRRAMVGRGLAGAIIRNLLLDMSRENDRSRKEYKGERSKIRSTDLARLRREDGWERLQSALIDVFQTELSVAPFNDVYHNYIRVNAIKGNKEARGFVRFPAFNPRDLMAEGSGFLQWLSVYTLALSDTVDVLLLDEPDAHLHPSLQSQLIERLSDLGGGQVGKQILLATHSTEILRWADHKRVMAFTGGKAKYLENDTQKINLFLGLGSDYAPKLDPLRKHKRMLIVENHSDARMLQIFAKRLGRIWPDNLVIWPWTGSNKERKQLFGQLKAEIATLKAISLRDRDDEPINQVDLDTLRDKSFNNNDQNLQLRIWRRRHIENYVLWPSAIARASGKNLEEVEEVLAQHALAVPQNFASKQVAEAMCDARGKEITRELPNSISHILKVTPEQIAEKMNADEVPEDVTTILDQLEDLCRLDAA